MLSMDDGPANAGARQVDHFLQTAFHAESLETIARTVRDQQAQPAAPPVKTDPMGIIQVPFPFTPAPEIIFQMPGFVIMHDILRAIAICDKYIPVLIDGRFSRHKLFRLLINTRIERGIDGEEYFTIHSRLIHLMFARIRYIQEFSAVLFVQGQTMRPGEIMPPGLQEPALCIIDEDIIMRFIGQQQDPAGLVLHHLMTVIDRILTGIAFAPGRIQGILHPVMTVYFLRGAGIQSFKEQYAACGGRGILYAFSSLHLNMILFVGSSQAISPFITLPATSVRR